MQRPAHTASGNMIAELTNRLDEARRFNIGFPGATDFDYSELGQILTKHLLNNVGDPYTPGVGRNHTKTEERAVVDWCADLFRAPIDDRWGYVSSGGSESNLYALHLAKALLPRAVCYFSDSAHYSIDKSLRLLSLPAVRIRSNDSGEIDYDDLRTELARRRDRPAIVVASIGTTMTEAVDDVRRITGILDDLAIRERFIHADAALAGIPLALLDPDDRPGFDFADGADSVSISGHKFLGSPMPCSVVITKASQRARAAQSIGYVGAYDTTIGGSRSGHAPLILWHAINRHGRDGLHERAEHSRALAAHVCTELRQLGWDTFRHRYAFTAVLRTPPEPVLHKWAMASHSGWSHVIPMPGTPVESISAFLQDMAAAVRGRQPLILAGSNR